MNDGVLAELPGHLTRYSGDNASRVLLAATRSLIAAKLDHGSVQAELTAMLGEAQCRIAVLLRTLLCVVAIDSRRRIEIGTPCCTSVTLDEMRLVRLVAAAGNGDYPGASTLAATLLGGGSAARLVPVAEALSAAFADSGWPLGRNGEDRPTIH